MNSESESENLIAEAGVTVQINDMLGINDFGINLPAVRFPGPGGAV